MQWGVTYAMDPERQFAPEIAEPEQRLNGNNEVQYPWLISLRVFALQVRF